MRVSTRQDPKAGSEILDFETRDVRREQVVELVRRIAVISHLRALGAGADHHVIVRSFREQVRDVLGTVLPVAVHQDNKPAARGANAAFDRRAVADIVWVADHAGAGAERDLGALVH